MTTIEWTDETWNPTTGCHKVSPGCKECFAKRLFPRVYPGREFEDVRTHPERLEAPLRWKKPRRIFVNSMSDLFHEDVPDEFIDQVFAVMGTAKWHTFQVLTKRPQRMLEWFSEKWQAAPEASQRDLYDKHFALGKELGVTLPEFALDTEGEDRFDQVYTALDGLPFCTDPKKDHLYTADGESNLMAGKWPLPNVWLGVSVEDQATADERIPLLLRTPAAVRFISAEPLLGPIDLDKYIGEGHCPKREDTTHCVHWWDGDGEPCCACKQIGPLDWVIAGGESGPRARPSHPHWFAQLRHDCKAADVPFFFKQWGEWSPDGHRADEVTDECFVRLDGSTHSYADGAQYEASDAQMHRLGKKAAGRTLDGRTHDDYPEAKP